MAMHDAEERGLTKKTIVLHPIMDDYVRRTWALLIEAGHEATYSLALNFMLLATIQEATKDGGLTEGTREVIWDFLQDRDTIKKLNLQEHLHLLREGYGLS